MDITTRKILVIARGDYIARLTLQDLLESQPKSHIKVIIVTCDSHSRKGLAMLGALWRDYALRYFIFEFGLFIIYQVAQVLNPRSAFTLQALTKRYCVDAINVDNVNSPEAFEVAKEWSPDIIVSAKCPQRINKNLLDLASLYAINVHGSLLPSYAGRTPHFWAMAHGEKEIGTTLHEMTDVFDEGVIFAQERIAINEGQSVFSSIIAVAKLGSKTLQRTLTQLDSSETKPQDLTKRSYYSSPSKSGIQQLHINGYRLFRIKEIRNLIAEENSTTPPLTKSGPTA